ncbi:hypothetical protein GYA28_04815 [Candidatus Roizmanbacteria bacterium]|jgi:hypothetical protein|nr:hypothetical protein [Candidatus Roizmanbacteria bacterium]
MLHPQKKQVPNNLKKSKFDKVAIIVSLIFFILVALNPISLLRGPAPYPPEWQYPYLYVNTWSKIWAPGLVILFVMGVGCFYKKSRLLQKNVFFLSLLVVLSYLFQMSVLFFSRSGVNVLFHRITNPGLNGYFSSSLEIKNIGEFLRQYGDVVLQMPMHAKGHPPGTILFFHLVNKISSLLPTDLLLPSTLRPERGDVFILWQSLAPYQRLGAMIGGLAIPFLSSLGVIPVYYLARILKNKETAAWTTLFYIFTPAIVLFTPLPDVFFPVFGVAAFFLAAVARRNNNYFLVFLSGMVLSLGLFFGISLLPIVLMVILFLFLNQPVKKIVSSGSGSMILFFLFGIAVSFGFLYTIGYDSFSNSIKIIGGQAHRSYLVWIFYNLYDYFLFLGIPTAIVYFANLFDYIDKKTKSRPVLVLSTLIPFLILNFSGLSRAETGRIWSFFMPFFTISAVQYLIKSKASKTVFLTLILLQAVQILFIQEFWVTLW